MNQYGVLLCIFSVATNEVKCKSQIRKFPPDFWFGASSSAYQIEGGWLEDGKGLSIWDVACHSDPSPIADEGTGDVSADSYHLYKKDVELVKQMGLHFYRFSISWPRILNNGFADKINQLGIKYYHNLIDELLKANITPFVTMYHWDLPYNIQKLGGWSNPLIVDWFADYAKVLFDEYSAKVKYWITINEPHQICSEGYGADNKAPFLNMSGIGDYICAKNVLLAHAKTYHLYDEHYRKLHNGSIGISIGYCWYEPASDTPEDQQAADDARQFEWGIYTHPIFSYDGDFPVNVRKSVAYRSAEQNFPRSRLPELSAKEVSLIKGSADFLGANAYTTKLAYRDASLEGMYPVPSLMDDMGAVLVKDPAWTQAQSKWLQEVPWGLFKLLVEIKHLYSNPPVYITENGWSNEGGLLDEDRIHYLRTYLNALLDAIDEDCDIRGYSVWSLIDSFEWNQGYNSKFGLHQVDFTCPEKTRTPRKSAFIYKEIARSLILNPDFEPEKFFVEVSANSSYETEKPNNW